MCLVCLINAEERLRNQSYLPRNPSFSALTTLVHNNEDGHDTHAVHYFAIGSMTNEVSLALRELSPISSKPAVLRNHKLVFRGKGGMATVEEENEYEPLEHDDDLETSRYANEVHGVLHLLSRKQMTLLDKFEGGYQRKVCTVFTYNDDIEIQAVCYVMDKSQWPADVCHDLPSERYLDIIAQGCAMYNVEKAWIDFISSRKCIPRKNPLDFQSFVSTNATVPIIHWDTVQKHNGITSDDLWIVINNKVLKFTGDKNSFFPYGYFVSNEIGGTDFTLKFAKGFYEPKYKLSPSYTKCSDLEGEHRAWIEDQFANPPPVLAASTWEFIGVVTEVNLSYMRTYIDTYIHTYIHACIYIFVLSTGGDLRRQKIESANLCAGEGGKLL